LKGSRGKERERERGREGERERGREKGGEGEGGRIDAAATKVKSCQLAKGKQRGIKTREPSTASRYFWRPFFTFFSPSLQNVVADDINKLVNAPLR
jgi:hypothetical protein